ncbi:MULTISPECIES: 2-isopropylmalate synthase [unclassified Motilimonas]|uniref:2-isopropylmalate synthase n=1 Tax=Motilimonas TaxID=1914248 RepID=UPI001E3FF254|nr:MULTISPECIES: 2-isopropylmalate synthase [unclassified Motilimonas]MCE0558031.1 2-isopropylmalate synthase [Motilimonas sp. E26]MDO6526036.1 2-isopropylmalate synthase [Motilimonas sp. 1_MG-2023]
MSSFNHKKYKAFQPIKMVNRQWPDQVISQAPLWCSVDLRDGNQALIEPMSVEQKKVLWALLVKVGFKEIEVGFPAASQPDFDFVRWLIEEDQIPDDVTIQVLTQARPALIERSFEALKGAKRAVVHLYNSTSTVQREQVFKLDRAGILDIAVKGTQCVKALAQANPETQWTLQYSPESFTGTELDFAVEICDAVVATWQPSGGEKVILNLPATVEMSTPNVYADQIEWFINHVAQRENVIISLHTHNDRGCGVAAAELGVMAGADRIEGTLLGNGERTGNMDVVTMAMNLYSQGIDPELDFSNIDEVVQVVKACTQLPVHPRHPYAGELVFTAFSGSHQDAIKKCLALRQPDDIWNVAYLPIDPTDLGRDYQEVIRINSQSGKGGIAWILERELGVQLPRWAQIEFSSVVQKTAEQTGAEVSAHQISDLFKTTYLSTTGPYVLGDYHIERKHSDHVKAKLEYQGQGEVTALEVEGIGRGALDAFVNGLQQQTGLAIDVIDFAEHAMTSGAEAEAITYLLVKVEDTRVLGVAVHQDIMTASLGAVLTALNIYTAQQVAEVAVAG